MTKSHLMLVIGASASGKTTFARHMVDQGDCFTVRSLMTRADRPSDLEREIRFCSKAEFKRLISSNSLVESETFKDNFYGTEKIEIRRVAKYARAVKVVMPQGAEAIMEYILGSELQELIAIHLVYVNTEYGTLINRLNLREDAGPNNRISTLNTEIDNCDKLYNKYDGNVHVNRVTINGNLKFPKPSFSMTPVMEFS